MNCIDAVEGTAKSVIDGLFQLFIESNSDDTEYIRNIRAIMDSTGFFLQQNREITGDPETLKKVLYEYARNLWITNLISGQKTVDGAEQVQEQIEYHEYCFNHIYNHGTYPL
jgi:hypothetical protein